MHVIHIYVCACMYACMYACTHVCMYAYIYVCIYICMHIHMHVCTYACMYVCTYQCLCVFMYVCTYESMRDVSRSSLTHLKANHTKHLKSPFEPHITQHLQRPSTSLLPTHSPHTTHPTHPLTPHPHHLPPSCVKKTQTHNISHFSACGWIQRGDSRRCGV